MSWIHKGQWQQRTDGGRYRTEFSSSQSELGRGLGNVVNGAWTRSRTDDEQEDWRCWVNDGQWRIWASFPVLSSVKIPEDKLPRRSDFFSNPLPACRTSFSDNAAFFDSSEPVFRLVPFISIQPVSQDLLALNMSTSGLPPSSTFVVDDNVSSTVDESQNPTGQPNQNSQTTHSLQSLEDPADPYYLHHADNPGNVLVSQYLTGQNNYPSWSRAMKLSISVKNKMGFLNTSIPKPSSTDVSLYNAWVHNNNMVLLLFVSCTNPFMGFSNPLGNGTRSYLMLSLQMGSNNHKQIIHFSLEAKIILASLS
ncbi:uncharacterized protein LOC133823939 isoform X2 [Humulus lupulus]|uniref:uncharacterized protein LOC133823939 isoform X2 n=1 Tax=Humulus lupulus TaxID=3486 RepID=UPI002B413FAF|nr:uncharacterized protein LOC133823939 isoform X2 [Humulus lupulus]